MPRQASGTYVAPANTAAVSGQTISSIAYNSLTGDMATELTNSVDRLGRGAMEANLNMGGYAVNNVLDPVGNQDAATKNYVVNNFLSSTANAVQNASLAQGMAGTVKGTYNAAPIASSTVNISISSPGIVMWAAHGLSAGTPVYLQTTGALPGGLNVNQVYYTVGLTANSFQLANSPNGTPINTTGADSGIHTCFAKALANEQDLTLSYLGAQLAGAVTMPAQAINLKITNDAATPDTKIDVSADYVILPSIAQGGNVQAPSVSVVINCTTTGANALDTGALAPSTWYHIYLISNGSTVAGLASASATSPTLPAGYIYFVRLGAMQTDGSTKFYRTIQRGRKSQYVIVTGSNTAQIPQLIAGTNVGSITTPTYVSFQVTGNGYLCPSTATEVDLAIVNMGAPGAMIVAPNGSYGSYSSTFNPPPLEVWSASGVFRGSLILESDSIYAASNFSASGVLALFGWSDSVPAA